MTEAQQMILVELVGGPSDGFVVQQPRDVLYLRGFEWEGNVYAMVTDELDREHLADYAGRR